jgi:hypothetical protein
MWSSKKNNVLTKCGFLFDSTTNITEYEMKSCNKRLDPGTFDDSLFVRGKTQYLKIGDCGMMKFIWRL